MAKCPKCGHHLHIYNISQFCPECGVNMRYVDFEENFLREAKQAELSHSVVKVRFARVKAALIGGRLQVLRLVLCILPLLSLLIPSGAATVTLPYCADSVSFSALGLYSIFTNGVFGYINTMTSSELLGRGFSLLRTAVFVYCVPAVFAVLIMLLTILCFLSIKNMQKIIAGVSFVGVGCSAASLVFNLILPGKLISYTGTAILTASGGFGLIVTALMFALVAVVNIILDRRGIEVKYPEGSVERAEIYRKVKAGEVSLDDLPQPVVETAETRKIDEEIEKENNKIEGERV